MLGDRYGTSTPPGISACPAYNKWQVPLKALHSSFKAPAVHRLVDDRCGHAHFFKKRVENNHNNHNSHNSHNNQARTGFALFLFLCVTSMDESSVQLLGAAWRRRQRPLRSWWRHEQQSVAAALATMSHHSAQRQKTARAGEGWYEVKYTAAFHWNHPLHPSFLSPRRLVRSTTAWTPKTHQPWGGRLLPLRCGRRVGLGGTAASAVSWCLRPPCRSLGCDKQGAVGAGLQRAIMNCMAEKAEIAFASGHPPRGTRSGERRGRGRNCRRHTPLPPSSAWPLPGWRWRRGPHARVRGVRIQERGEDRVRSACGRAQENPHRCLRHSAC